MSKEKKQSLAVLVIAFLYNNELSLKEAIKLTIKKFGLIKATSDTFYFTYSKYYEEEMGENLKKIFIVFESMISRESLVNVKKITDKIELKLSKNSKRTVNIDPAILTLENFILATNKNFTHRIYLKNGVFADLTLIYKNNSYTELPWTYSDYGSEYTKNFLNKTRKIFYDKLIETSPFAVNNNL